MTPPMRSDDELGGERCVCCGNDVARREPDPWEGRMDDYCERCCLTRCDAEPRACKPRTACHPRQHHWVWVSRAPAYKGELCNLWRCDRCGKERELFAGVKP
jgi:hypothetical protein